MSPGRIAWQNEFKGESCYSGTATTAGGLLFVGKNDGNLVAYDEETGKELWHWQTGAGANATVSVFEDEGEEKIALYAGGNSLAATAHGENFWVFSLKGTMEEAKGLEEEEKGTTHAGEEEAGEEEAGGEGKGGEEEAAGGETAEAGGAPNAEAGKEVFAENCSVCHGATGHGGNGGPDLRTMPLAKEQAGAEKQVTDGGGGMPAFKGQLSEEEISNVAAYVVEDIVGGK
jgi:mono/diheme cytochrome c family protein